VALYSGLFQLHLIDSLMEAVRSTCHSQFCTAAAAVVVMILVIVVVVMVMLAVIVVVMVMVTVTVMVAVTDYHDL
jgi:hypothetical protein